MEETTKPRYFKIQKVGEKLFFEHIDTDTTIKNRGHAIFYLDSKACYVNGAAKNNLIHYFSSYKVRNTNIYSNWCEKKDMLSDIYSIEDDHFRKFLIALIKNWNRFYRDSNVMNLGTMLSEIDKFKNMSIWIEQGFTCNGLISITPDVYPKDVRKIIRWSGLDVSNYFDANDASHRLFLAQLMRDLVTEKIPTNSNSETNRFVNWELLLQNESLIRELVEDHGYETRAILRYLFNYIIIYEGLSIHRALSTLRDYANMHHLMGIQTFKRYPKYLASNHDIITTEYNQFKQKYDEQLFKEKVRRDLEYRGNEFVVLVPRSTDDIKREGKELSHCVGSYISRIINGQTQILFLREQPEYSMVTIEVRDNVLIQAKGEANRAINRKERSWIERYAKEKGLIVRVH